MKAVKWVVALAVAVAVGFGGGVMAAGKKDMAITPVDEVKWSSMDPNDKEGKGPQIAVVFGDLKKKAPLGVLLKLSPDAKPGPHTHSSDYWGVTIKGVEHNFPPGPDTGKAIAPGGFWYQPANQPHDNHCEPGSECVVFLYFPKGMDFKPAAQQAMK
jgi:hypothetical protein